MFVHPVANAECCGVRFGGGQRFKALRVHLFIFFACLQVESQKTDSVRVLSASPLANSDNKKEKTKDKKERKEKKEGEKTKKEKKEKRKLEGESLQVSFPPSIPGLSVAMPPRQN